MGISYGPVPLTGPQGGSQLPEDDWMCGEAVPMWGRAGRGDLRHIRRLGANAVRLYGNNPNNDHTTFLDEAHMEGLEVLPGMSDFPYFQQAVGNCQQTNYDCFTQVKPLYGANLQKGFLVLDKTYHPALRVVNILNEPDLKMPPNAVNGGADGPIKMSKAIISAFDAMLEAEKEAGVVGPLINFTATFSYAICNSCTRFSGKPALGQIAALQDAMYHPENYDYTPRNNITAAFEARWVHSFNTQNPATDLQHQFLDDYNLAFPQTPVYIGEYHRVGANQTQDLSMILEMASRNILFQGISFFQYQVAYWKGGSELAFGMMGLGSDVLAEMPYFGSRYDVHCLDPVTDSASGGLMADAVAHVYDGFSMDIPTLCVASPWGAALRESGFTSIASQNSAPQMALYVEHVLQHMGATVTDSQALDVFAGRFAGAAGSSFASMMGELGARPAWTSFDSNAKCVANRYADPGTIGNSLGWACSQANAPNCSTIPEPCQRSTYSIADYVFSRYYEALGGNADPLAHCDFGGAGIFAASLLYSQWTGTPECVAGSSFTFPPTSSAAAATTTPVATSTAVPDATTATVSETTTTTFTTTTTPAAGTSNQNEPNAEATSTTAQDGEETTPAAEPTESPINAAVRPQLGLRLQVEFVFLIAACALLGA